MAAPSWLQLQNSAATPLYFAFPFFTLIPTGKKEKNKSVIKSIYIYIEISK